MFPCRPIKSCLSFQPLSRLLRCFIECGLGCGQEVQEYKADGDAADCAYKKERRDVAHERGICLSRSQPGKYGLLRIHEPSDAGASAWSQIKNRSIQESKDVITHADQPAGRFHFLKEQFPYTSAMRQRAKAGLRHAIR
jgi:hypothetical protein